MIAIYLIIIVLAFYVAWNLGANDVANSMGTSVGSKAITLKQALIIAGILEFSGAVFFGQNVSTTLATEVINPSQFIDQPKVLLIGMISVLISCGLWLQIATKYGLPVASSHVVIGAISGFSILALGLNSVNWPNILTIAIAWLFTPLMSGIISALFYKGLNHYILQTKNPFFLLREWIPWLSAIVFGLFGVIVMPKILITPLFSHLSLPVHDSALLLGGIASIIFTIVTWKRLENIQTEVNDKLEVKQGNQGIEKVMAGFQVLSACFVAFAHGSNDVGNAIAPLSVTSYILNNKTVPLIGFQVPYWILILGGLGIVAGLSIQGKNVIQTVGEKIIPLQPSSGFCAEIATAATVLLASRLGLPVSTSHALVGGVLGIGLSQNWRNIQYSTVKSVILAWMITLPMGVALAMIIFKTLSFFFNSFNLIN
jgi:inorganic phosphate transporter, PiT family